MEAPGFCFDALSSREPVPIRSSTLWKVDPALQAVAASGNVASSPKQQVCERILLVRLRRAGGWRNETASPVNPHLQHGAMPDGLRMDPAAGPSRGCTKR
jgi:hypothetical protein